MEGLSGTTTMMSKFNYEAKVWGATPVRLSPFYIQGLKLQYALDDLRLVKGKVLDIGCGGGNMAKAIKYYRPDLAVYGVDISEKAISIAQQNAQKVIFNVAPVEHLSFPDKTFDAVLLFDVLEHVLKPEAVLHEIHRVLKEGGVLHIFSPLDKQPLTLHWWLYLFGWKSKDKYTGHIQWFSDYRFRKLLLSHHFLISKRRFSFHPLFSLFDVFYYSFQDIVGAKQPTSLEGRLKANATIYNSIFHYFYKLIVALGYYESVLLKNFPLATGGHYTATKGSPFY